MCIGVSSMDLSADEQADVVMLTLTLSATRPRSLTESNKVPDPNTWNLGSLQHSWAIDVRRSTGFDTTRTIASDLNGAMARTTLRITEAFRYVCCMPVSPASMNQPLILVAGIELQEYPKTTSTQQ